MVYSRCVLLFLASRVAETASEGTGGIEGTVKAAARWHAGEEKRKEEKEGEGKSVGENWGGELGREERTEKLWEGLFTCSVFISFSFHSSMISRRL